MYGIRTGRISAVEVPVYLDEETAKNLAVARNSRMEKMHTGGKVLRCIKESWL